MKFLILLLIVLLNSGCSITPKSPEQLINEKPIYSEENYILYNKIKSILPTIETTAILPENSVEVGKINKVDINNDSTNEIVVFEKKNNISDDEISFTEIVVNLLVESGQKTIEKISSINIKGDGLRYANFYDLNNDKIDELVLVVKNDEKYEMYIYSIINYTFKEIYNLDLSKKSQEKELRDLKIEVGDIDNDNFLDIVILNQNKANKDIFINILDYKDTINIKGSLKLDNIKSLSGVYIKLGQVYKGMNAIIIDYPSTNTLGYNTQIITFKDSKIIEIFGEDYSKLKKSYYIEPIDINEDNILDFPITKGNLNNTSSSFNVFWYNYNGLFDNFADMNFLNQTYYNYNYNFEFLIPNCLVNRIYIDEENGIDETIIKFNYIDDGGKSSNIFSIIINTKGKSEDKNNLKVKENYYIGETNNNYFRLIINDLELFDKLKLSVDSIKENFSYID